MNGTTYTATLSGTQDLSGNVMTTMSWSFTTAPDITPPTVVATTPANGATPAPSSTVTATFSEAVQNNTISFVLTDQSNNTIPATWIYDPSSQTVTLTSKSPLAYSTTYTVTVSGTQDLAGNVMTPASWSFTTEGSPDTTPPTVVATTPANGATAVALSSTVTATFSEAVQESTISFVLTDQSNNTIPAILIYDPSTHTVTFTPGTALSYATTYTATLSGTQDSGRQCDDKCLLVVHDAAIARHHTAHRA